MAATKTRRRPYPWFLRWSRIDVVQRGGGYVYRITYLPTGAVGEGIDRDEAVEALRKALSGERGQSAEGE